MTGVPKHQRYYSNVCRIDYSPVSLSTLLTQYQWFFYADYQLTANLRVKWNDLRVDELNRQYLTECLKL